MPFQDYSNTATENTELEGSIFIGPNMARNDVRPALQQLAADGRGLRDEMVGRGDLAAFVAAGVGAVERTALAKMREGAVSVDDYPTKEAAQTAVLAESGGALLFPRNGEYSFATPMTMAPGMTYLGSGRSGINQVYAASGAKIMAAGSAAFVNGNGTFHEITTRNLFVHSQPGGGHIFDWSVGEGVVDKIEITGGSFVQENAAKYVIKGSPPGTGNVGVFSTWIDLCDYQYATANSVPPLYFSAYTINSIVVSRTWSTCTTGATSGVHSMHFESTNASGPAINCVVRDCVFELPGGGSAKFLSCANSGVETSGVYDLAVAPAQPQFEVGKGASGPPSNNIWFKGVRSTVGTSGQPDIKIDTSVAGQAGFVVDCCTVSYLDGGDATPAPSTAIIASDITNFQNIAYTRLGASPELDLHFGTTDAASKEYTIWNGYSGNNQGYLNIHQNGAYKWAFTPAGDLIGGGTLGAPNWTLTAAGGMVANSYIRVPVCTVAQLPAAGAVGAGARAMVSDASATTFASNVAGGGANVVPVYSDGTNWKIG